MKRDNGDESAMEIAAHDREKRWVGVITYAVFFAIVAGVIVVLMRRFTGSLWLAIALVTFMVAYMLLMGWLTSRHLSGSDRDGSVGGSGGGSGRWR